MCEQAPLVQAPVTFTLAGFVHQTNLNNTFVQSGPRVNRWPAYEMKGVEHIWCCRADNGRWNIQKVNPEVNPEVKGQNRGFACSGAGEFPWDLNVHWKERYPGSGGSCAAAVQMVRKQSAAEHIEVPLVSMYTCAGLSHCHYPGIASKSRRIRSRKRFNASSTSALSAHSEQKYSATPQVGSDTTTKCAIDCTTSCILDCPH